MMDFILTSILMFGMGVLVGRLFYKLNPFFMLFGLLLGGTMFAFAVQRNTAYSIVMIFGIVYGLSLMKQRNTSITDLAGADGSLLGKITDFFYFKFLLKDAEKFKQQQAQEDSAYDEYKEYEKQAQQDSYDAQAEAKQRTEQARRASDSAREKQEDIHKQWHKFQKEKEKFEQEKAQDDFVDTRNNYEILGVAETASLDEIKKAFKKISMKFHPDRNRNKPPKLIREAEKEFIKAQHAYEALTGKKAKR